MSRHQRLFAHLLDDASMFPPGSMDLDAAVRAHARHLASGHGWLVGPLVVAESDVTRVGVASARAPVAVSVTASDLPGLGHVVRNSRTIAGVRVRSVEVPLGERTQAEEVVDLVAAARADCTIRVYVELPRDERRDEVVASLAGTNHFAKVRTGGVDADLYPDETELAAILALLISSRVPFKATAGLHHALRNVDRVTGFEQHGFLNVLAAVDLLILGGTASEAAGRLAEREADSVVAWVRAATDRASPIRSALRSFGTCSISDPRDELAELGFGLHRARSASEGGS